MLAVGGGGAGSYGGDGSGYLQYLTRTLSGPTIMRLTVGDSGEASQVTVSNETIVAEAGQDAPNDSNGGNGYSGGGAQYNNGGYNGGDGDSFYGDGYGGHVINVGRQNVFQNIS